eukprot:TRINITY_DN6290_c0_g1_i1.p1 TRINITY_DN6290_c0_g1~~TRINITY_DN6290_c0_g1_i1.p1  ORF type:complete len:234 (+),score=40.26 TRINITY_DN6290_c0_g1_i1:696-1397(+)
MSNPNEHFDFSPSTNLWGLGEVCQWLKTIPLSKDYSEVIRAQNITGEVLSQMNRSDWESVGVNLLGDQILITKRVQEYNNSNSSNPSQTNKIPASKSEKQEVDISKNVALLNALMSSDYNLVVSLLNEGLDVNSPLKGDTPLYYASMHGSLEIVRVLLDRGANVNFINSKGYSPLCIAIIQEHVEIVSELLERGASVSDDDTKVSPITIADGVGNEEITKLISAKMSKTCIIL